MEFKLLKPWLNVPCTDKCNDILTRKLDITSEIDHIVLQRKMKTCIILTGKLTLKRHWKCNQNFKALVQAGLHPFGTVIDFKSLPFLQQYGRTNNNSQYFKLVSSSSSLLVAAKSLHEIVDYINHKKHEDSSVVTYPMISIWDELNDAKHNNHVSAELAELVAHHRH